MVLCGANSYTQKFYIAKEFSELPESIRQELQIMCVLYVEDVGGILTMEFDDEGNLEFRVEADDNDYLFDDIGSALKIKQIRGEKRELLESLELYYRVFILKESIDDLLAEDDMDTDQDEESEYEDEDEDNEDDL